MIRVRLALVVLAILLDAGQPPELLATPDPVVLHWSLPGPTRLEISVDKELALILPTGERVERFNVDTPGNWQITVNDTAKGLVIRVLRLAPDAAMTLTTNVRTYNFILAMTPDARVPNVVRLADQQRQDDGKRSRKSKDGDQNGAISGWKLIGNRELWPSIVRDDGAKTFIEWPNDVPLPAVFALDRLGREEMVNGYMRGSFFTIDRVYDRLMFRIDKTSAEAQRKATRPRK